MIRPELRRRIYRRIDDDPDSPTSITAADVNALIDEAIEVLSEEVRYLSKTAYVPLFSGAQFYNTLAIDPLCLSPVRVWAMDRERPLDYTTIGELNRTQNNWLDDTYERPHHWFSLDHQSFGIYPRVTTSSGEVLRIDYYAWAEPVANDQVILPYSDESLDAVINYVVYSVYMRRWDMYRAVDAYNDFVRLFLDSSVVKEVRRFNQGMMARANNYDPSNRLRFDR